MIDTAQFLLLLLFAIPIFIFGLYGLVLIYYGKIRSVSRKKNRIVYENEYKPFVSVVTPTHNEEIIISKKIENLLASNYPSQRMEIIFVDDSDDSTSAIIERYSLKFPNLRLIKFSKRMGYSPCVFAGVRESKGDIIVLSDAGSFHDENTISNLVRHFNDPKIGAVTGNDVILNNDEEIGSSEAFYQRIYNFVRVAETNMDSTFYFKGEASAVRKELISDLDNCGATFDTAVALYVRRKGYKTIFDPQARFYEYAPKTHEERIKQKTIRAANWIKILFRFRDMAFNYRYGKFGLFTLPANFGMLLVAPLALLLGFVYLIALTFFDPFFSLLIWGILGAAVLSSFLVSKHILGNLVDFEFSLISALYELLFTKKKHDQIETVTSTRR